MLRIVGGDNSSGNTCGREGLFTTGLCIGLRGVSERAACLVPRLERPARMTGTANSAGTRINSSGVKNNETKPRHTAISNVLRACPRLARSKNRMMRIRPISRRSMPPLRIGSRERSAVRSESGLSMACAGADRSAAYTMPIRMSRRFDLFMGSLRVLPCLLS